MVMLDTNILIELFKNTPDQIQQIKKIGIDILLLVKYCFRDGYRCFK